MFSTITSYIWGGETEECQVQEQESIPGAQEVEDWIVVGGTPSGFQEKAETKSRPSPKASKQRLQSLMFGDSPHKNSGSWARSNNSGNRHHQYKANFNIKMAGNRNLKQC